MIRKLVIWTTAVIFPIFSSAQLQETDTSHWQANLNISGRLNTGNFERFLVAPEVNIAHLDRQAKFGMALGQRYTYGTFGDYRSENDLLSRNFIYWKPRSRVYPYFMAWFQKHERQQLLFRYQVGPGVTYALIRKKAQVFKVSLTATFEQNRYKNDSLSYIKDQSAAKYEALRATLRIAGNHLIASGLANFYYEGYFQQAVDNKENWRVFAEGGITIKMIRGFGTRIFATYEYQKVLVKGQKPNDLIFNFGLNYKWSSE